MGVASLAQVMRGWTGSIVLAGVTTTPLERESVASLMARAVMRTFAFAERKIDVDVVWTGVGWGLRLVHENTFAVSATGTVATRTGLTGTYSGSTSYTSTVTSDGFAGSLVPSLGLRLNGSLVGVDKARPTADGTAATLPTLGKQRTSLRLLTTIAEVFALENGLADGFADGEVDVWFDGRVLGRVTLVGDVVRRPLERRANDPMNGVELALSVMGVS
jgi:hypothetical protein